MGKQPQRKTASGTQSGRSEMYANEPVGTPRQIVNRKTAKWFPNCTESTALRRPIGCLDKCANESVLAHLLISRREGNGPPDARPQTADSEIHVNDSTCKNVRWQAESALFQIWNSWVFFSKPSISIFKSENWQVPIKSGRVGFGPIAL